MITVLQLHHLLIVPSVFLVDLNDLDIRDSAAFIIRKKSSKLILKP